MEKITQLQGVGGILKLLKTAQYIVQTEGENEQVLKEGGNATVLPPEGTQAAWNNPVRGLSLRSPNLGKDSQRRYKPTWDEHENHCAHGGHITRES